MPEICRFYGIVIAMFLKPREHEPSHIHAYYGEFVGVFELATLKMVEGDLPSKAQSLVKEWLSLEGNQKRLQEMWDKQKVEKMNPL